MEGAKDGEGDPSMETHTSAPQQRSSMRGGPVPEDTFKITITFVFSHEKQENKIFCFSERKQKGAKQCSESNATDPCPKEQQVTSERKALFQLLTTGVHKNFPEL